MPLNLRANNFDKTQDTLKNQTNTELITALADTNKVESLKFSVSPRIITKAVLDYFDEEVEIYKLSPEAKQQIRLILNSYFSSHNVFDIDIN